MGWIYQFFLCAHVLKVGNLTRMWKPASNGTWNPNSVTLWDHPLYKQSESNKSRAVSVRVCTAGSPPILQHHTLTSNHAWLYSVLGVHIFFGGKNILTTRTQFFENCADSTSFGQKKKKLQEERTWVQIHVFICTVFLPPIFPQSYMVWATWLEDSGQ